MSAAAHHEALLARIQKAFHRVFGPRVPFNAELTRAAEPRWNSLKHVEFLIALEQEFALRFDGTDATDLISIAAVSERIRQVEASGG